MINPNKLGRSPFPASASQWMLVGLRGPLVATGYSLSGPGAGGVGTPSTNFTVTITPAGGAVTGTVTVTPSDSGGGGTFTPSTVALTTASPSATFTYTAASAGTKTISTTNNGGLANPSSLSYIASAGLHLLNTLVSYWKLDETTGATTLTDIHGSNNFTGAGGLTANPVTGKINNAQHLPGGSQYWTCADNASLHPSGDFSFSLWVEVDNPAQIDDYFLIKSDLSTASDYVFRHNSTTGFGFTAGAAAYANVGAPCTASTWYHLVGWYDSTDQKSRLRVNDATTYVGATTGALTPTAFALMLGNFIPSVNYAGNLDEIGFWTRKLTTVEITALYNGGAGLPYSSFNP
jgi:hypothetical protein